jgi:hypothetical protein
MKDTQNNNIISESSDNSSMSILRLSQSNKIKVVNPIKKEAEGANK